MPCHSGLTPEFDPRVADGTTPARTYGYDLADQVSSATNGGGLSDAYNYDAMGNRSSASLAINGGATTTYTANNVNQYNSITGMSAPVHDANGNLTFQNGVTYTWDSENRLLSVTDGTTTNAYTYDGQHRRVTKRTTVSGMVTKKTHYLYDGWNVIEERTNYDTATTFNLSTFALTKTLTWGTDLSGSLQEAGGVGGLLMAEEISGSTTTAYHFHYDGNGNVTEITDSSGNPAATYRYDAFGNTLVATGSYATTNIYRFSTKPLDTEITTAPLYYYGYRYYDPITGRWPSRDPIEENGGLNLYGFVLNDSLSLIDPDGRNPAAVALGVVAGVFSIVSSVNNLLEGQSVAQSDPPSVSTDPWGTIDGKKTIDNYTASTSPAGKSKNKTPCLSGKATQTHQMLQENGFGLDLMNFQIHMNARFSGGKLNIALTTAGSKYGGNRIGIRVSGITSTLSSKVYECECFAKIPCVDIVITYDVFKNYSWFQSFLPKVSVHKASFRICADGTYD